MSKPRFNPNLPFEEAKPKFDPNQGFDTGEMPDVSELESGVRGLAQGASFGFADEITGALEAALSDKTYDQARDESRRAYTEAQEVNPFSYGAGQLGGAMATVFVPGLGEMNIAKAAAMGAAQGLGDSEAKDVGGMINDAGTGAAIGGAFQYGFDKVLKPAAQKLGKYIGESGPAKAIGKTLASVAPEDTERYLTRSSKVNNSLELEDLGQYFKDDALQQFQDHVGRLDSEAWKALDSAPSLDKQDILKMGEDYIQTILGGKKGDLTRIAGTGADADKIRTIVSQLDEIKNAYGNQLSEADLKSVVQSLQKLGWSLEGSPRTSIQGQALQQLSGVYNDLLKSVNPVYAEKMIPVQEATSTLQSLNRQFINQQTPEQMDKFLRTAKKFGSLSDESEAVKAIRGLDNATGADLENMIKDRLTANAFDKTDTNGSRKTLGGAIMGKALEAGAGGVIGYGVSDNGYGAAVGAMAGMSLDKYAGQLFKQMLNGQIRSSEAISKLAPYLGKFSQPLMDAASRGSSSVAATHFILQQTNPEYRQMMQKMNEEK